MTKSNQIINSVGAKPKGTIKRSTKEKPELKYWGGVSDVMAVHCEYPSVTLIGKEYGLSGKIQPNGYIKIQTTAGGGHGEGRMDASAKSAEDWLNLINEAEMVRLYYYGSEE